MKHIIIIAAILATSAQAQEATIDTACGAAGTGYELRYTKESPGKRAKVLVVREEQTTKPGALAKRVDADGVWVACRVPPKVPACPALPETVWGGTCSSSVAVKAGEVGATRQIQDKAFNGRLYLNCTATGWAPDMGPHRTYCR